MQTPAASAPSAAGQYARGPNAHDGVTSGEIAIGVIIGRTSEFFDFFVYAIASVVVFPKLVFPYVDALTGTLYSFSVFALAFVARPIGTVIFMAIDRAYGRGIKLTIALFLLGTSTVAIAFLPGYQSIGSASAVLLCVFRIGQGFALGGAWDGLPSLLALNAPPRRRGWYAMIPQLGAPLGLMVASALFAYFVTTLSAADFLDWGWRYPFFVAFAINVVALFARLRIVVTPEYSELFGSRDLEPEPVVRTLRAEGRNIVIGAFAPLASFALFHMVTVFPLSWVFLFTQEGPGRFLIIEMVARRIRRRRHHCLRRHRRSRGPAHAARRGGGGDRRLQRVRTAAARRRRNRRDGVHAARLRPAWALVRPVVGCGGIELLAREPLHRPPR